MPRLLVDSIPFLLLRATGLSTSLFPYIIERILNRADSRYWWFCSQRLFSSLASDMPSLHQELLSACADGDIVKVRDAISSLRQSGTTDVPIVKMAQEAAENGHAAIIEICINEGLDINEDWEIAEDMLINAVWERKVGHPGSFEVIVSGIPWSLPLFRAFKGNRPGHPHAKGPRTLKARKPTYQSADHLT